MIDSALGATSNTTFGVVPVENSTNGPVAAALDQLTHIDAGKHFRIVGEVRVPVRHCLVSRSRKGSGSVPDSDAQRVVSSLPNFQRDPVPDLNHLKELHTHPQAWGQCNRFMKRLGLVPPGAKPVPTASMTAGKEDVHDRLNINVACYDAPSTSSAAAKAAADASGTTAAISSHLAAEAHGADILLEGLEDSSSNVTRFLIIQSRHQEPPQSFSHLTDAKCRRKALVTFILTPTRDGTPGALSDVLGVFAKQQLSLTSINARPKGEQVAFEYTFIIEVDLGEVSTLEPDLGIAALDRALADLRNVVAESTCLGIWQWKVDHA